MIKNILTGIQVTGDKPHLGNLLGAIIPAIASSKEANIKSFFFIADMHSLTQIKDKAIIIKNTYSTVATWLAFGLDTEKTIFYRQSDLPQVTELTWYLSCLFPYKRLQLAHSFKDKSDNLKDVNVGLFTYPMLMAADILICKPDIIPVGKDQLQHIEITRSIAKSFNHTYGETFSLPQALTSKSNMLVEGTDGEKMSKSKGNIIDILADEETLKKQIFSINTDTIALEKPKNYTKCIVFKTYESIASENQIEDMKERYTKGGYGYGDAKKELLSLILSKYEPNRKAYIEYLNNQKLLDDILEKGAEKAKIVALKTINEVRNKVGFK